MHVIFMQTDTHENNRRVYDVKTTKNQLKTEAAKIYSLAT